MKKSFIRISSLLLCFLLFVIFLCIAPGFDEHQFSFSTYMGDYIWNYQMIQKVHNGYLPYSEINIIVTPLFHLIGSLFMNIFGTNFLVYDI